MSAAAVALLTAAGTVFAAEDVDPDPCESASNALSPVEVRCSVKTETPGNGVFVTGSVGVTVYDGDEPAFNFDQPVGRTGAAADVPVPPAEASHATEDETIVPHCVVDAPFIGCTPGVDAPTDVHVYGTLLPGGSSIEVATAGGGGTLTIGETCFDSKGCDPDGGGEAVDFGGVGWEPTP